MTVNPNAMYLKLGVVFVTLFQVIITEKCVTPNNEEAECVSIYSCKILIDALFKADQSDINEFVRKSKCEGRESDRMVCCGSTSRFSAPVKNKTADKDKLLPNRTYCGYQHSDDYFRNETSIGINEFPWLAALIYHDKYLNETVIRCSGSLISNRYVLTAARCIDHPIGYARPVGVRLGEYNTKTDEDCTEENFYECSEPPQNFDIEKMILHPQFNKENSAHNIGLLRLSKIVQYSDYVRPICLPTAGTMFAKPGDILLTSGWGAKNRSIAGITETKKKIYTKLITNEDKYCTGANSTFGGVIHPENNFCMKELENNTDISCPGDIGAPAIFSFRNQWHQEGVGSICTCREDFPVVYTRVVNYLEWIKQNIEP